MTTTRRPEFPNWFKKFCTVVLEVSLFVSNPVLYLGKEKYSCIKSYSKPAEGPGVAREKKNLKKFEKKFWKKFWKKNFDFLGHLQATYECPQKKIQPIRSSRFVGQREHIYIYMFCFII